MHERADTAKEILARADDFLQQTCPKYAATAALCSGGYDDPLGGSRPAPGKSRVKTRPATGGRRAVAPGNPARPAETRVGDPSRAQRGEQGLGRISGAGPAPAVRRVTRRGHPPRVGSTT